MMNLLKKYQNVLIISLVVVAAFVAYSIFLKPSNDEPLTVQQGGEQKLPVEQELIPLLLELKSITLDTAVFDDERFRALKDFGQEIIPEPSGRSNPFAPLGK